MASLEVIRAYKALNLNELPEFLSIKQIAKLYYPANDKTDDRECIEEYIQTAIDSGSVQISSGEISKGEHSLDEWIKFFDGLDCGSGKLFHWTGTMAFLKERLINGWPSKWEVQTKTFIHQYSLISLISSSHYEAWAGKPEPTEGNLLNGWLGISKQGNKKQQVNVDTGKGNHAGTEPKDKEVTAWLRETWIIEGKPGGTVFFTKLKKYVNQKGSPIVEHYSAGKDAGFRWETSAGTTGRMAKKTISNKVSIFNNKP